MAFEKLSQSVQFNYVNEGKYGKNGKTREYKNVKFDAGADELLTVGGALSNLMGDELGKATLITKHAIKKD